MTSPGDRTGDTAYILNELRSRSQLGDQLGDQVARPQLDHFPNLDTGGLDVTAVDLGDISKLNQ